MESKKAAAELQKTMPSETFIVLNLMECYKSFKLYLRGPISYRPKIIGHFSINSEGFYKPDTSQLKYYVYPAANLFPLDVTTSERSEEKTPRPHSPDDHLDNLLTFIVENRNITLQMMPHGNYNVNADIVCTRKVLETLMCTPFHPAKTWKILATKYHNTIYMCMGKTKQDLDDDPTQRRLHNWEVKMRQFLYADEPNDMPDPEKLPDKNAQFLAVHQCKIANMSVMYSSPMCGVFKPARRARQVALANFHFVETRLGVMHITPSGILYNTPHEMLVWWSQCFLTGVNGVHVAYANPDGLVDRLFKKSLTWLARDNAMYWKPNKVTQFLEHALRSISYILKGVNNPSSIYEFEYVLKTGHITCAVYPGRTEQTFIADWYRDVLENID